MRSDVPVGACLSGGLDSSAVVSDCRAAEFHRMSTFTTRFEDRSMDEWSWAQRIHDSSPVTAFSTIAAPAGFLTELPVLISAQEEPIAGPGVYAQWRVMQLIKEHGIRVVLDGQGGDELLCGYAKYVYWAISDLIRNGRLPAAGMALLDVLARGGSFLFDLRAARRYLPWNLGVRARVHQLLQPGFCTPPRNTDNRQAGRRYRVAAGARRGETQPSGSAALRRQELDGALDRVARAVPGSPAGRVLR